MVVSSACLTLYRFPEQGSWATHDLRGGGSGGTKTHGIEDESLHTTPSNRITEYHNWAESSLQERVKNVDLGYSRLTNEQLIKILEDRWSTGMNGHQHSLANNLRKICQSSSFPPVREAFNYLAQGDGRSGERCHNWKENCISRNEPKEKASVGSSKVPLICPVAKSCNKGDP